MLLQAALRWLPDVNERFLPGSPGDVSECESYGSSEGLSSHQGNNKLPVSPAATPLDILECRPRPPVIRSSSGPHDQRVQSQPESPLHQGLNDQSAAISLNDLEERTGHPVCPLPNVSTNRSSPFYCSGPLTNTHNSRSTPSLVLCQSDPQTPRRSPTQQTLDSIDSSGCGSEQSPVSPDCHTEKLHIWHILSKDNGDALPETLVWRPHMLKNERSSVISVPDVALWPTGRTLHQLLVLPIMSQGFIHCIYVYIL